MTLKVIRKNLPRLATIIIDLILFICVCILMRYVERLLYSDVKINLTEVVTQNKDVITSKLQLEVNNIELFATQMEEKLQKYDQVSEVQLKDVYRELCDPSKETLFFISTDEGKAMFSDGAELDISGRKYYRLAMEGVQNVSDKIISRIDGNDVFVISVPLYVKDKIVGTVQKMYSPEEMYRLCMISLFSSQGYMSIINSDGYIIVGSNSTGYNRESDNYYRLIYSDENKEEIRKLQKDIEQKRSGFMETIEGDRKIFSAYTPIEDIHDWFLITSIDTNAVSPNSNIVIKMFYVILFVLLLVFAVSMLYFLSYKRRQQLRLEHIAFYDTVTHGNTYNKFIMDVGEILARNDKQIFYILSFDIDNFKYVNSYYGFDKGDKILKNIYDSVNKKLMQDEMIARISGDHFVVLLKNVEEDRMKDILKMHQNEEGVMVYFTAGLYEIKNPSEAINLMVDKATTAAQDVKGMPHLNKKTQVYSERFDEQMIQNEQMKRAVEQALEDDEILPFFQPKVDVNTGRLVGAEALARWITKDGTLIPPFRFIPISEKTGLITELDMVIFEKTLQFIKRSLMGGVACVPISVNFSRLHLSDKNFINKVWDKISEYEIPANLIEMEITESAIFENSQIILDVTNKLHEYGVSISMDDFGSGYSSLNMLNDIPIDVLKIDRAFLKETENSEKQRIILSAIANMAIQLNIKVVVEGVETIENVNLMKDIGLTIAQGYFYAKPMDEGSFGKIYREGIVCLKS